MYRGEVVKGIKGWNYWSIIHLLKWRTTNSQQRWKRCEISGETRCRITKKKRGMQLSIIVTLIFYGTTPKELVRQGRGSDGVKKG